MSSLYTTTTETLDGIDELVGFYQPGFVFVLVDKTDMYFLFQTGNKVGKNIRPTDVVIWPSKGKAFSELSFNKLNKAKTVLVLMQLTRDWSQREILSSIIQQYPSTEAIKCSFPGKVALEDLRGTNPKSLDKIFLFYMENEIRG